MTKDGKAVGNSISHDGQPGAGRAQDLGNSGAWLEPQNETTEHSNIDEVPFLKPSWAVYDADVTVSRAADSQSPATFSTHRVGEGGHSAISVMTLNGCQNGIQLQGVQGLPVGIISRVWERGRGRGRGGSAGIVST